MPQELPWACFCDVTKNQTRKCAKTPPKQNHSSKANHPANSLPLAEGGRSVSVTGNQEMEGGGHAETHPDSLSCNGGRLTAIVTKACTKFSRFHDETGSRAPPAKLSEWDNFRVPAGQDVALTKKKNKTIWQVLACFHNNCWKCR